MLVEGIAEQLVVPTLALLMNRSFAESHVAIVRVDGVTFKHFLPLFGAGADPAQSQFALKRRVACLVDADPARRERGVTNAKRMACFPFQLDQDSERFEYFESSGVIKNLRALTESCANVEVFHGAKTFEYDLAFANSSNKDLVTTVMGRNSEALKLLAASNHSLPEKLQGLLDEDELHCLSCLQDGEHDRHRYAAVYLRCAEDVKGGHAFELEQTIRTSSVAKGSKVVCPDYIKRAIEWVTPKVSTESSK